MAQSLTYKPSLKCHILSETFPLNEATAFKTAASPTIQHPCTLYSALPLPLWHLTLSDLLYASLVSLLSPSTTM